MNLLLLLLLLKLLYVDRFVLKCYVIHVY
jgi:hypothetical protein